MKRLLILLALVIVGCSNIGVDPIPSLLIEDCDIFEICATPGKELHNVSSTTCLPLIPGNADDFSSYAISKGDMVNISCLKYDASHRELVDGYWETETK